MLHLNDKVSLINIKREKRGLINGLGSIIKSITGNLDETDKERYDQIIENINVNENKLTDKINTMVKINNNITAQFNNKIKIINENNIVLNKKLDNLEESIGKILDEIDIIKTQNLINELIQVAQELYFSLIMLEETITFCQLNTLYFGIINYNELIDEINKIGNSFIKTILINNIHNNNILKTYCSTKHENLIILIEIPSNVLKEELMQVTSIPTYVHDTYKTVNILNGLYTKNNCRIKPVNRCSRISNKEYYCLSQNNEYEKCLENVICYKDFKYCAYNNISLINSIIEIKNSKLKYLYFPHKKQVKFYCNNELFIRQLKGIYHTNNCQFNDQIKIKDNFGDLVKIHINSTKTHIKHIKNKIKNISLIKHDIESDIFLNSLYNVTIRDYHYILIYVIIELIVIVIIICKYKNCLQRKLKKPSDIELKEINKSSKNVTSILEEGGIM